MTDGPAPARRPTSPGRPDGWAAAAIAHFLAAVVDLPQPQKVLLTAVQQLAQTLAANRVAIVQAGHVLAGSDDAGDTDGPKRRRLTRYTVPSADPCKASCSSKEIANSTKRSAPWSPEWPGRSK